MKPYLRTILLSSGMLAVVIYLLHILIGGFLWKTYSHLQQPISDLTATGVIFGGLTGFFFAKGLPYFGLVERINIGTLQIWTFVVSYKLLKSNHEGH